MTTLPKIYRLGERHTIGILEGSVTVEEKYDGSQFSFGTAGGAGPLECRSKNQIIDQSDPGMFRLAVETAQRIFKSGEMLVGAQYQCEFIAKPKHNVLTYGRVPVGNLVLFDIRGADGVYRGHEGKRNVAESFGIEPARVFHSGGLPPTQEWLDGFLAAESSLGGCKVEGVVIKNYARNHTEREGHPQTAKVVSDAFKEVKTKQCQHVGEKAEQDDRIGRIVMAYRTEARWLKAVQHLREENLLTNSPKDIGPLLAEVFNDTITEELEEIKEKLFELFKRELRCGLTKGFPEWYLAKLEHGFTVAQEETVGALKPETQYALDQLKGPYVPEECA